MRDLALGLMSGTSGDGASLTLASFAGHRFRLHAYQTYPYPRSLSNLLALGPHLTVSEASRLNILLGEFFAACIARFLRARRISPAGITVIGSHGQTLHHGPSERPPNTLQLGEPSVLAERTGIPVVADFRMRDLAAGGEGAPLIPFFDWYFFGRGPRNLQFRGRLAVPAQGRWGSGPVRALQNVGGIANVTVVGKTIRPIAFDTGPGNTLIDWAVRKVTRGKLLYDRDGILARRGFIDMKAVGEMAGHPYFSRKPPKSTGVELFHEKFIPRILRGEPSEGLVATLTYLTAFTIRESYLRFVPHKISEILVSGGGALNRTLMMHLANLFRPIPVRSIADCGIPPQAKEPLAFSFFALQALRGKINHLPHTTGASRARILGKIIPGNESHAGH